MRDGLGREINYLRLSITDRCNLRCAYCMPPDGVPNTPHADILRYEELLRLAGIFAGLGVDRIRVTGGEPLVRKGAADFIADLRRVPGVSQVFMTTNGTLLTRYIGRLAFCLDGINVSLDTLNPAECLALTGRDELGAALAGVDAAAACGVPVKINCVPLRGLSAEGIADIALLAMDKAAAVRFIELMPIGRAAERTGLSIPELRAALERRFGKLEPCGGTLGSGPARYYHLPGFRGKIGFIEAIGDRFCKACNRIRLTPDGRLRLCLAHDAGLDLRGLLRSGASDTQLRGAIASALASKPAGHAFEINGAPGVRRSMHEIGG